MHMFLPWVGACVRVPYACFGHLPHSLTAFLEILLPLTPVCNLVHSFPASEAIVRLFLSCCCSENSFFLCSTYLTDKSVWLCYSQILVVLPVWRVLDCFFVVLVCWDSALVLIRVTHAHTLHHCPLLLCIIAMLFSQFVVTFVSLDFFFYHKYDCEHLHAYTFILTRRAIWSHTILVTFRNGCNFHLVFSLW